MFDYVYYDFVIVVYEESVREGEDSVFVNLF